MKKKLLRIASAMCVLISIIIVRQITTFADEVKSLDSEKTGWMNLAPMSKNRQCIQTEVIDGEIYVIGGQDLNGELSLTEKYNPTTNGWTKLAPMTKARRFFNTEVVNGKIYAIGGDDRGPLSSVEVYNPTTNSWTMLASMLEARSFFQTEVIDGKIYALGGYNNKALTSIEVYDPIANIWTKLAPMSEARRYIQTEVIDGKIYAIGGDNGAGAVSTIEVYDPIANSWTKLASMSDARRDFQTVVMNGKIFAIGGFDESEFLSTTEVYDPVKDRWTKIASMSEGKSHPKAELINGKIYVIGGFSSKKPGIPTTEVYDPSTNIWTKLDSLSDARCLFQTEAIDGKIYAIGGRNSEILASIEVYTVSRNSNQDVSKLIATWGDSRVNLSWSEIAEATSYTVKRSTTAGGPYTTIAAGVTGTTYSDTDVTNGTTYYYVVTAIVNGSEGWSSNEASATPQASTDPNQPTGNKALLVISMVTGERKEYEMTTDKINDFIAWYNSKAASSPTYMIEKDYNKASFTARKDYIAYDQISNFEVNEYND